MVGSLFLLTPLFKKKVLLLFNQTSRRIKLKIGFTQPSALILKIEITMTLVTHKINQYILLPILFITLCVWSYVKCNSKIQDQDIPDVAYKARAFNGFFVGDTTKKPPPPQMKVKPVISRYTLSGSDTLFNILYLQIVSPLDVTPRNLNTLKEWVQKNLKPDTLISKQ